MGLRVSRARGLYHQQITEKFKGRTGTVANHLIFILSKCQVIDLIDKFTPMTPPAICMCCQMTRPEISGKADPRSCL